MRKDKIHGPTAEHRAESRRTSENIRAGSSTEKTTRNTTNGATLFHQHHRNESRCCRPRDLCSCTAWSDGGGESAHGSQRGERALAGVEVSGCASAPQR